MMSSISQEIERYLKHLLEEARNGMIEVRRSELAEIFNCVPSQINYVLGTRFTPVQGYVVETRRGWGGFVRIVKVDFSIADNLQKLLEDAIGDSLNYKQVEGLLDILLREGILTKREALILSNICSDNILSESYVKDRNALRARMLEVAIVTLLSE